MKIIPGLPNNLGLQCLVRVPYKLHNHLRAVSKRWNAVLSSPEFYKDRQRHNECEEGIAFLYQDERSSSHLDVIIYYPLRKWWERLPPIPEEFNLDLHIFSRDCVFVYIRSKQRLVAMDFLNSRDSRKPVLMFDFLSRTWQLGLDMPFWRLSFACAVSPSPQGLVYTAGGANSISRDSNYVFNVEENKWDSFPHMKADWPQSDCAGDFIDDKFYVVDGEHSVHVYDPHTRLWKIINTDNNGQHFGSFKCVSAFGKLYSIGWPWREWVVIVKEFDIANNSFTTVGEYPNQIWLAQHAVLFRDCIFVSGMDSSLHYVYYLLNLLDKTWTQMEMPAEFPRFSHISVIPAAVQI